LLLVPITLITGPANAGKAEAVMDAVRAQVAGGRQPLLVVPTRSDVDRYTRELAGAEALMGTRVLRFDGLLEEIVRRGGANEPALSGRARERLLARVARRAGLLADGDEPISPGLARGIAELLTELRVQRVTPPRLAAALAQWARSGTSGHSGRPELARLFEAYEAELARLGRADGEQRVLRAIDALRRRPARWNRTPVLIYGFDDLSPLQLDAIESLGRVVDAEVTVSLSFEAGRTAFAGRSSTFAALDPQAHEHRELAPRGDYYAPSARAALSHLERSLFEPDAARISSGGAVRLLEGGGERAELELVAEEIATLIAGGMAPGEIALATRTPGVAPELLEEVLGAAGVPFTLQRRRRLADSAIGAALLGLLRCVPRPAGAVTGSGADLLAWLRAPGLLEVPALADALERDARIRGLAGAAEVRELWEQRNWPLTAIDRLEKAQSDAPAALVERTAHELGRLLSAPRQRCASVLSGAEADEGRAHAAASRALEQLGELAALAPELLPRDAWGLAAELAGVEFLSGEPPAPDAVAVLDPLALRAHRVKALFLCGLQEGVFPARQRRHGVISEEERRELAEASGLRLGQHEDALASERYLLYAAVSRPEELLALSWHVADDDGLPTPRSLFVEDVCDLFEESLLEAPRQRALGAVVASTGRGPAAVARPAPDHAGGLSDERVLTELRTRTWSASQLETLIGCPVRWYVERVLRPGAYEPDAEPLRRGGLAHVALSDTLEGLRERTGSASLTSANLPVARELLRAALTAREHEFPLSAAPERLPGARLRLRAELERYLDYEARADSPLEPGPLELSFGFAAEDGGTEELPAFDLGGGVTLRGRIDRVDLSPTGDAVVLDYKSRVAPAPARWISDGRVQVALYMLAVESLLGRRAAGGFYQPLSGSDLRARGVLDEDSEIALDCVRGDARPHEEVRELLGDALELARSAAAGAQRGELVARPRSCSPDGCSYPSICRCRP
jgi:ATP-dependent helicase/DNAse subunit B